MQKLIRYILVAVLLLIVQVLILNNIHLGGYATPFLYIWLILKLPNELSRGLVITLGFFFGFIIDLFSNTPGMHAFATTSLAYMKEPVMALFIPREDMKTGVASVKLLGLGTYFRFLLTCVMLYCSILYVIEAFTFFDWSILLLKAVSSAIFTLVLILGVESLNPSVR